MAACRTLDEIWEQAAADGADDPPFTQAGADQIAAILAPCRRSLAAREPQAA